MCAAPKQGQNLPAGVDTEKETVLTGQVLDTDGNPVAGAFVRLLDGTGEFTAEVVASGTGDFRFFAGREDRLPVEPPVVTRPETVGCSCNNAPAGLGWLGLGVLLGARRRR